MSVQFTERETQIMAKAWLCMDAQPKIDYQQLAEMCGFTNVGSASNAWSAIKKKLLSAADKANGSVTPKPKAATNGDATPKSTGGKKRGAAKAAADGTPSKKARKPAVKKEPAEELEGDYAGEDIKDEVKTETAEGEYDSEAERDKALMGEL